MKFIVDQFKTLSDEPDRYVLEFQDLLSHYLGQILPVPIAAPIVAKIKPQREENSSLFCIVMPPINLLHRRCRVPLPRIHSFS